MKIPVQSPLQHVANHLQHAQHIIHQTLINFGKNVITNRDIKNKAATLKVSQFFFQAEDGIRASTL